MAIGLLLIILGVWVLVNGFNGNIAGLFANPKTTSIDTTPASSTTPIITQGKK